MANQTFTCQTEDCVNFGVAIELEVEPNVPVACGPCGTQITK